MKNNSDKMIKDFDASQLKRMQRLVMFLALALLLMFGLTAWVKVDQRHSNDKLNQTFKTLKEYVEGEGFRSQLADKAIQQDHDKLFKAISCLLILHDSHAITDPKLNEAECKKAAQEINYSMSPSPSAQNNTTHTTQNTNSNTSNNNQQPNKTGGGDSGNVITKTADKIINSAEGIGRWLGGKLGV